MRLSWVRALPRSLWGSPGAPELCRSLCQRPARVPAEGTPKPGGGDTARGDTARGNISGGDTLRGDTLRGDTRRGDTSRDEIFRGDTFRGDIPEYDTLKGDTLRGDTFRGDTSRGITSVGDTSVGDALRGDTSRGDIPRYDTLKGDTFKSDTFRGDTSRADTLKGDTLKGDTPGDDTSRGDTFTDDTLKSATSKGDTSRGATSGGVTGDAPGGDTPKPPRRHLRSYKTHREHREDPEDGDTDPDGDTGDPGAPGGGPAAFRAALRAAGRAPPGRGGRLALVEAALAAMPALGVERSLGAYNALLRLLPRGPWVPRGAAQRLLFPFPRQQECGLRLLEQMERYGVIPDAETRFLLLGVFGPRSRPLRKVQRMLFWLPRFRHLDPHPLPPHLPRPGLEAAHLGLRRMATDPAATVTVMQPPVPDTGEDEGSVQPYIVSSQSPEQRELLARHDPSRPVFVEGPFPLWLRGTPLRYFVLRGDPLPPELRDPPPDPERSFYFPLHLELELERGPWDQEEFQVEEVEEGPVFALCVPGSGDRLTLARWISGLQEQNPVLGRAPVVFRLGEGLGEPPGDPQTPRLGSGTPPGAGLEPPEGKPGGDPPKTGGE